jgi:hypothetical protein
MDGLDPSIVGHDERQARPRRLAIDAAVDRLVYRRIVHEIRRRLDRVREPQRIDHPYTPIRLSRRVQRVPGADAMPFRR